MMMNRITLEDGGIMVGIHVVCPECTTVSSPHVEVAIDSMGNSSALVDVVCPACAHTWAKQVITSLDVWHDT